MKLRPLHYWVVIDRSNPEATDLWLPDTPSNQGRVIAVGPKVKEVCVGDWAWFNRYAGADLSGAVEVLMIREGEISCVGTHL